MSKKYILCADDENIILQSLRNAIKNIFQNEYNIEIAESGEEALEIFSEIKNAGNEIPVVIIDYIMPGMKGDELLKRIHDLSSMTQKIMLSGQATIDGVTNAINNANLFKYIEKPWDNNELKQVIQESVKRFYALKGLEEKKNELNSKKRILERTIQKKISDLKELQDQLFNAAKGIDAAQLERNLCILEQLYEPLSRIKSSMDSLGYPTDTTDEDRNKLVLNKKTLQNISTDEFERIIKTLNSIKTSGYPDIAEGLGLNSNASLENLINQFQDFLDLK